MTFYIIRHGQTVWNHSARKQGQSDSPLTWLGITQAEFISDLLARELVNFQEFKFFVSPLARTRQYAQLIMERLKIQQSPVYDVLIKEHSFGSWEGLNENEIESRFPGELGKRRANWWNYRIPGGGESYSMLHLRVARFLKNVAKEDCVIITHEMVSKVIRGILQDLSPDEVLHLRHDQNVVYRYNLSCMECLV